VVCVPAGLERLKKIQYPYGSSSLLKLAGIGLAPRFYC